MADANCTYTVEESQHCFTIHGKCQKMNRLVVPGDRIRCEDLDYMELCSPPSLCQNDLGQTFPEVGHALVDCQYSKPVTIKGCQGTDYGCRKLMRITSKLVGLKPKCKNFIYWVACPEQICRDSRQSKHDPESDISTPCPFEGCDGKFDHWNVGKENWTDYEKTLYDAEVPEIFREFVDQAEGIVTTGSATKLECTYRTINGPCHFQKVMHKNQKKLTCLYFEDRIQVNNGAIGCESMIRSMKPCPLSECRKKCDEVLPPWSSWGPCSASCRSEDADYLGRSSQPFRMRHRFDDQRVRTGCKLTESIYCSNLPLCPPTKNI
uniref:Uncharacterized protein n=1 Tax=Romanomermis culicivorax TaxID=13658 RepID=A0A915K968_ROMCU